MSTITLEEAQSHLASLVEQLQPGEEILITRNDEPVAKLVGQPKPGIPPRRLGTLKGTVLYIAPDFNAPLDEFKDYMP